MTLLCPKCGKELKDRITSCPSCNESNPYLPPNTNASSCPYCGEALDPDPDPDEKPIAYYCVSCRRSLIRCEQSSCRALNRPLARFCTACSRSLPRIVHWSMASFDASRSRSLNRGASHAPLCVPSDEWPLKISAPSEALVPDLITVPDVLVVPHVAGLDSAFEGYGIYDGRLRWRIPYGSEMTYASTPVRGGAYMFFAVPEEVWAIPLAEKDPSDHVEPVVRDERIVLSNYAAPMAISSDNGGRDIAVFVFERSVLVMVCKPPFVHFFIDLSESEHRDTLWSPVYTGDILIITTLKGTIYEIEWEVGGKSSVASFPIEGIDLGAPVWYRDRVYLEGCKRDSRERCMLVHEPRRKPLMYHKGMDGQCIPKGDDLNVRFMRPPLVDTRGHVWMAGLGDDSWEFRGTTFHRGPSFNCRNSIQIGSVLYIAEGSNVYKTSIRGRHGASSSSLALGVGDRPRILQPPVVYDQWMFILCEDRVARMAIF